MKVGKWIFGALGWSVGGPIGAVLGFVFGKVIFEHKKNEERFETGYTDAETTPGDLKMSLLLLMAAIMKADGQVRRSELDHVKKFLNKNFDEAEGKELLLALREMLKQEIPLRDVCRQIKAHTDHTTRYHLMEFLVDLAASDYDFDAREKAVLQTIRSGLGISIQDYSSMFMRYEYSHGYTYEPEAEVDPYAVLGVSRDATDEEVKRAYRRLAQKFHPDKVAMFGEERQKAAAEQFREINEAYSTIKEWRGIK